VNHKYPIADLLSACREYVEITNRRLTFEWALIYGVNDSVDDARELARLLHGNDVPCQYHPAEPHSSLLGSGHYPPKSRRISQHAGGSRIPCTIRLRRGIDIEAGCGQLAIETNPNSLILYMI